MRKEKPYEASLWARRGHRFLALNKETNSQKTMLSITGFAWSCPLKWLAFGMLIGKEGRWRGTMGHRNSLGASLTGSAYGASTII